jgi:two-component system chemotaxis response regulator CheB
MDVKAYSGITIVQNPGEAMFPSMPNSAIENVQVDRVASLDEIGPLLTRLAREPVPEEQGAAFMARNEANDRDVAEVGSEDLKTHNMTGPPSNLTCPECGGALWEIQNGKLLRYRCHVGHGYTAESLMVAQAEKLEDALWSALRALEETAGMRRRMAERARKGGWDLMARNYDEQAAFAETRAGIVRAVLVEEKPEHSTAKSAEGLESKSAESRDWDAGRALLDQPESLQPSDEVSPPDPLAVNSRVQSASSRDSGKGRSSSSRKVSGAKGKSPRRAKSD